MKKSLCLVLLLSALLLFNSCKKEDLTASTDITAHTWQLQRTKINGKKTKTPTKDDNGDDINFAYAYRLIFLNDTTFSLSFSVNTGGGDYTILSPGQISLTDFGITEMCCDTEYDTHVINTIAAIHSYRVLGDELVLEGDGVEYWFLPG